jgi:hypothetical protein
MMVADKSEAFLEIWRNPMALKTFGWLAKNPMQINNCEILCRSQIPRLTIKTYRCRLSAHPLFLTLIAADISNPEPIGGRSPTY